jgi:hypothetical protein
VGVRIEVNDDLEPAPGFVFHRVAHVLMPLDHRPLMLVREWWDGPTIGPSFERVEPADYDAARIAASLAHYYPNTPTPDLTDAVRLLQAAAKLLPCGSK